MKYSKKNIIWTVLLLFLITSCYDDKGNYDLLDLNEIEIEGVESIYTPNVGDTLQVIPRLSFSKDKELSDLSFEWHLLDYTVGNGKSQKLLSDKSELSLEMTGELGQTGEYPMIFRVKDQVSGVYYSKPFTVITGGNPFWSGYALLCEKPDGFDIDFISYYGKTRNESKFTLYPNIWTEVMTESGFPRIGKPLAIECVDPDIYAPSPGESDSKGLYVSTDQLSTKIKYSDFSYKSQYELAAMAPTFNDLTLKEKYFPNGVIADKYFAHNFGGARIYMYINNNWFFYNTYTAVNYITYPFNRVYENNEFSETFTSPPFIYITSLYGAIIWNQDQNKFMVQYTTNSYSGLTLSVNTLRVRDISESQDDIFLFNNPNYRLIYLGTIPATGQSPAGGFAVVENIETNKFEYLEFRLTNYTGNTIKQEWAEFEDGVSAEDLRNAKYFVKRANCPYFYYATEDKVYTAIVGGNIVKTSDISNQVLRSPYTKVSAMKYTLPYGPDGRDRGRLGICTYNPNGEVGKNGKFTRYIECYGQQVTNYPVNEEGYVIIPYKKDGNNIVEDSKDFQTTLESTGQLIIATDDYESEELIEATDEKGAILYDDNGEPVLKKRKKRQVASFEGVGKVVDYTYKY